MCKRKPATDCPPPFKAFHFCASLLSVSSRFHQFPSFKFGRRESSRLNGLLYTAPRRPGGGFSISAPFFMKLSLSSQVSSPGPTFCCTPVSTQIYMKQLIIIAVGPFLLIDAWCSWPCWAARQKYLYINPVVAAEPINRSVVNMDSSDKLQLHLLFFSVISRRNFQYSVRYL